MTVKTSPEKWQEKVGFYFLPNAFTLTALFFAFLAITESFNGRFANSGMAVVAAFLLDGVDGRIARLTGKQGVFGEQLDSIADMVSFGLAPALIIYISLLHSFGKFGYMVAFVYAACAALRLALFNSLIAVADKKWFIGLPSPSAASVIVGFVWMWVDYFSAYPYAGYIALILTVIVSLSMIAPVKFWSFKGIDGRRAQNYNNWFIVLMLLLLFATQTPIIYFSFFFIYLLVCYLLALKRYFVDKKKELPL